MRDKVTGRRGALENPWVPAYGQITAGRSLSFLPRRRCRPAPPKSLRDPSRPRPSGSPPSIADAPQIPSLGAAGLSRLYTINLTTGAATLSSSNGGAIGSGTVPFSSIVAIPEP